MLLLGGDRPGLAAVGGHQVKLRFRVLVAAQERDPLAVRADARIGIIFATGQLRRGCARVGRRPPQVAEVLVALKVDGFEREHHGPAVGGKAHALGNLDVR